MPSGTRNAEWRITRKSARTKRCNFQVPPRSGTGSRSGFWGIGYLFKGPFVFAVETLQKWVLVPGYLETLEDYVFQVSGFIRYPHSQFFGKP